MLRQAADLLGAFNGSRSWNSPWHLDEYANQARLYGLEYIVFPNDNYAHMNHRKKYYTSDIGVDHDDHVAYLLSIKEMEDESQEELVAPTPVDQNRIKNKSYKHVSFAPGI
jgi:hypothetical protein